jgi:hypothetical protein
LKKKKEKIGKGSFDSDEYRDLDESHKSSSSDCSDEINDKIASLSNSEDGEACSPNKYQTIGNASAGKK